MPSAARSAVAPLYLLACLILGGSAQGVWQSAILQLAGLGIIAWAASSSRVERLPMSVTALLMLGLVAVLVVALQSVPMPPAIWAKGARDKIAEGYGLLGPPVPALPPVFPPVPWASAVPARAKEINPTVMNVRIGHLL